MSDKNIENVEELIATIAGTGWNGNLEQLRRGTGVESSPTEPR